MVVGSAGRMFSQGSADRPLLQVLWFVSLVASRRPAKAVGLRYLSAE